MGRSFIATDVAVMAAVVSVRERSCDMIGRRDDRGVDPR
jgi:hypothetical protein